jgi:circadian clock protein KaiC
VSDERISTGIARLDTMLGGQGYYRDSTVLVTGGAGGGKSSLAAHFVDAACRRGERCLYFAFEESPGQIVRNMRSIGLDLGQWTDADLLRIHAARSTASGLEMHLLAIHKLIRTWQPHLVVLDPIDNLGRAGCHQDAREMLTRLIDYLKTLRITAFLTAVYSADTAQVATEIEVSSLVDTWLHLRNVESNGERNRLLYILKSRGMPHSNQVREFLLTDEGIVLLDAYLGPEGVLTGAARQSQEAREKSSAVARRQELEAKKRELQRKRDALEARIAAMRKEFEADEVELQQTITEYQERDESRRQDQMKMRVRRQAEDGEATADSARTRRNARARP